MVQRETSRRVQLQFQLGVFFSGSAFDQRDPYDQEAVAGLMK